MDAGLRPVLAVSPPDPIASDPAARDARASTAADFLPIPLPVALAAALADHYRIERALGRGGMATVYLAEDRKHRRRVAVKVLHPELTAALGPERFLKEIELTANLQHPHILPLFDSGEVGGLLYYVMPYVEGETLRARLVRERQLPVADALRIATEVADALQYAHERGVIHRDVKPENVLLQGSPRGAHALVADFGIALAVQQAGRERMTQTGLSLGTPQYASPEQAMGELTVDARTDVYALGAVTYEMLAGEPPFAGPTAQAVVARVLTEAPRPLRAQRPAIPVFVADAVHRALEKLPADRHADAREFAQAFAGGGARTDGGTAPHAAPRGGSARSTLPWAVAALATALAAAVAAVAWIRGPARAAADAGGPTLRFPIALGEHERFSALASGIPIAFSPDDRLIAYGSTPEDTFRLLVRALDESAARPVPAAAGLALDPTTALSPAFSPDAAWIALRVGDRIMKVPLAGGPPVPIATLAEASLAGMQWLSTDTLLASVAGRVVAIPVRGGAARPVSVPDSARDEVAQWAPTLLPDGERVAYVSVGRDGIPSHRIATVPLAGGRQTITPYRGTLVLGAVHGHLLFVTAGGGVFAIPLAALTEDADVAPVPVLEGVLVRPGGAAKAALSARGSLVYQRGESVVQLTVVDARGAAAPLAAERRTFVHPRFSPDGRRVVVEARAARGTDVWLYTLADRTFTRLTDDGTSDLPEWSPDGTRVVYRAIGRGGTSLRWVRADGSGEGGVLLGADAKPYGATFTPDGRTLVYRTQDRRTLVAVPLDSAGLPAGPRRPIVASRFLHAAPRVSPDGRWLAYVSDETGKLEVYVRAFPGPGPRVRVSIGSGGEPAWSRDGRTVYYRSGRALLAARVTTAPTLAVSGRDTLLVGPYLRDATHANYDVAPDGTRFVMLHPAETEAEMIVVHGWAHELRTRLRASP